MGNNSSATNNGGDISNNKGRETSSRAVKSINDLSRVSIMNNSSTTNNGGDTSNNKRRKISSRALLPSLHVPVVAIGHSSSSVSSGCTMHLGQVGEGVEGEGNDSIGDVVGDSVSAGRTCRGVGVGDSVKSMINDLSTDNLIAIAEFLPKTSRVLLAVAMTAPSSAWRGRQDQPISKASKAIISSAKPVDRPVPGPSLIEGLCAENEESNNQAKLKHGMILGDELKLQIGEYYAAKNWGILDFVDVEKSLASRLNDSDLFAILACIDAKKNLKRLSLTHCFNIVGHGLEPLRGSVILKQLDLSLVRQCEDPRSLKNDAGLISQEEVVPILDDILSAGGNAFRRMKFPWKWIPYEQSGCEWRGPVDELYELYKKYNGVEHRTLLCFFFGFTGTMEGFVKNYLRNSELDATTTVANMCGCDQSRFVRCVDCNIMFCDFCHKPDYTKCDFCENGYSGYSCDDCNYCSEHTIMNCECGTAYCFDCLLVKEVGGVNGCQGCRSDAFDRLRPEYNKQQRKIERLRAENEELRRRTGPS